MRYGTIVKEATKEIREYFFEYSFFDKAGVLPDVGGLADQSAKLVDFFYEIMAQVNKQEKIEMEMAKSKSGSGLSGR